MLFSVFPKPHFFPTLPKQDTPNLYNNGLTNSLFYVALTKLYGRICSTMISLKKRP